MERALAHQRQLGGALDTALLELGLVPRRDLAGYLSLASGLPPPPGAELEPDPRARRVFPARVAERYGLAPFRLEGKELSLLATYPVDAAALDEISFMLSLRLLPHVAPEWQVRALLVNVYGGELSERFAALSQAAGEETAPEEPTPPAADRPTEAPGQAASAPPDAPITAAPPEPPAPTSVEGAPPEADGPAAEPPADVAEADGPEAEPPADVAEAVVPEAEPPADVAEAVVPEAEPPADVARAASPTEESALPESLAAAEDDFDIWIEEDIPIEELEAASPTEAPSADLPEPEPEPEPATAAAPEPETWTSTEPPDAPPHWTRQEALSALEASRSRDEVVTVALRYLRDFFDATAVFAVTRGQLAGHDAMGWPGARELCRRIRMAPADAPLFSSALATRAPFLGAVAPEPGNDDLIAGLGRRSPRLALVYPVLLRDRPVCILYADNGEKPVSPRRLGDLLLVLGSLGGALERVLRDAKRSRTAAPTEADLRPAPSLPIPEALAVPTPFDAPEAVRRLCLAPAGSEARRLLLAHIIKHGPDAAAVLRDAFPGPIEAANGSEEPAPVEERGPVLSALHALGTVAAPFLVDLLGDPSPEHRRWAALLLGRIGDPASFMPLAKAALDPDRELAAASLAALVGVRHHLDFRPVLEWLRRELAVAEADRQPRAAYALGALGDAEAIPLLVQTLETPGPVAEASARALTLLTARQFGHDTAAWISWWKAHRSARRSDWLFDSLVDPDPEVRSAAATALRLAASPKPPLDYRADAPPHEREDAARAWRAWWDEQRLEA